MNSFVEKFWQRTRREGSCFLWTAGKMGRYGAFYGGGGNIVGNQYAHRWITEQISGPIPKGMVVMHSCDNPLCVAPQHLSVGTHSLNHRDAVIKGRRPRIGDVQPGQRFGRWIAVRDTGTITKKGLQWLCRCDCGNERVVSNRFLRVGKSRSCGCLRRDVRREGMRAMHALRRQGK